MNNNINYLNGIQVQNVILRNSYYRFVNGFRYQDNDSDFPPILKDSARIINKFAYTLSELNLSTQQIFYAIILRKIKERFLSIARTKSTSIFFIPIDVVRYLGISLDDFNINC